MYCAHDIYTHSQLCRHTSGYKCIVHMIFIYLFLTCHTTENRWFRRFVLLTSIHVLVSVFLQDLFDDAIFADICFLLNDLGAHAQANLEDFPIPAWCAEVSPAGEMHSSHPIASRINISFSTLSCQCSPPHCFCDHVWRDYIQLRRLSRRRWEFSWLEGCFL